MMDWDFIKDMIIALNFSAPFVNRVDTCISSAQFAMMLNGQPSELFQSKKGIRQRDPISPFLFVIEMEYLSRILKAARRSNNFSFHPRCKKMGLNHFMFAYDFMLMCKGDSAFIHILTESIKSFSMASGLKT